MDNEVCKSLLTNYLIAFCQLPFNMRGMQRMANALYANIPFQHTPDTLTETRDNVSTHLVVSDDVFVDIAIAWMQAGANRVLTYEEIFPTPPAGDDGEDAK